MNLHKNIAVCIGSLGGKTLIPLFSVIYELLPFGT